MNPKTTLTITALIGLVFSVAMFVAPEFITREQFPNAEGHAFQAHVMRGYTLAFSVVCITNLLLQLLGKISVVPQTVGTGIIAFLSFMSWRSLAKVSGQN